MLSAARIDASSTEGEHFLELIGDPGRVAMAARCVALVCAHPDDETIGCGAQLRRLHGATVVVTTDGAPRDLVDARAHGFSTAADYAAARRAELARALAIADVAATSLLRLEIADQQAAFHLVELAHRLAAVFTAHNTRTVLTHAYEGGHPDHDATAFAVHAAVRLHARDGRPIAIIEMPFYRAAAEGWHLQDFAADSRRPETVCRLDHDERARKRRMMAAHATQQSVLDAFPLEVERFRAAPAYDFTVLPNEGRLLYERQTWGMTGARWLSLAGAALRELRRDGVRCD